MPSKPIMAVWNGPFDAEVGIGDIVRRGEEREVSAEDVLSDHWIPVGSEAKKIVKDAEAERKAEGETE